MTFSELDLSKLKKNKFFLQVLVCIVTIAGELMINRL